MGLAATRAPASPAVAARAAFVLLPAGSLDACEDGGRLVLLGAPPEPASKRVGFRTLSCCGRYSSGRSAEIRSG